MRFSDIPGQEEVKERLRQLADSHKVPHAILLQGPAGSGKFALARAFAQYIHCTDRHDGDSCGQCPSCRQMQSFNHIDTLYSFPVVKKGTVTVCADYLPEFNRFVTENPWMDFEAWLEALGSPNSQPTIYVHEGVELIRRLSYTARSSRYKVALMWLPERMQEETANKLLKVVEEPFGDTIFVMTSDSPGEILPTIYSRVQRISVKPFETATLENYLIDHLNCTQQIAHDSALLSRGNINKALVLARNGDENAQFLDYFIQLMRKAYTRDIMALKQWSKEVAEQKREMQMRFLDYCSRLLRENFVLNLNNPAFNLLTHREREFCVKFARFITVKNVEGLLDAFTRARNDIAANANGRIVLFDMAITTILLLKS